MAIAYFTFLCTVYFGIQKWEIQLIFVPQKEFTQLLSVEGILDIICVYLREGLV